MISKELLREVLGNDVTQNTLIGDDKIKFRDRLSMQDSECMINIYELAHKCKEWALSNRYTLFSGKPYDDGMWVIRVYKDGKIRKKAKDFFTADTEPEAIFKACEWIRKQND